MDGWFGRLGPKFKLLTSVALWGSKARNYTNADFSPDDFLPPVMTPSLHCIIKCNVQVSNLLKCDQIIKRHRGRAGASTGRAAAEKRNFLHFWFTAFKLLFFLFCFFFGCVTQLFLVWTQAETIVFFCVNAHRFHLHLIWFFFHCSFRGFELNLIPKLSWKIQFFICPERSWYPINNNHQCLAYSLLVERVNATIHSSRESAVFKHSNYTTLLILCSKCFFSWLPQRSRKSILFFSDFAFVTGTMTFLNLITGYQRAVWGVINQK